MFYKNIKQQLTEAHKTIEQLDSELVSKTQALNNRLFYQETISLQDQLTQANSHNQQLQNEIICYRDTIRELKNIMIEQSKFIAKYV